MAAVILAAVVLSRYERRTSVAFEPELVYPDLIARAAELSTITVADAERTVRLRRAAGGWQVTERHDYPADEEKIANLIADLARVRLLEPRSDQPDLQERMNLRDPDQPGSRAKRLQLATAETAVADLLIGETRRAAGTGPRQFYARRVGEARAWLAEGNLDPASAPTAWLAGTVIDIAQQRVRRVTISHPDGDSSVIERATPGADFSLADASPDQAVKQSLINAASYGIQGLPLNDVMLPDEVDISFDAPVAVVYQTFDGLTVTVEVASRLASSYYARLRAEYDSAAGTPPADGAQNARDPAAEATHVNDFLARWVFLIPPHTADTFTRKRQEFLDTEEPAGAQ